MDSSTPSDMAQPPSPSPQPAAMMQPPSTTMTPVAPNTPSTTDSTTPTTPSPPPSPEPLSGPYTFPRHRLKRRLSHPDTRPVVLVACGSFSPLTVLHLQMFEMTQRYIDGHKFFEVVGCYLSPVSDAYNKPSLAPAHHRVSMCKVAVEHKGSSVMVDPWETLRCDSAGRPVYTRTVDTLRHFDREINDVLGGIQLSDGSSRVRARIALLIGADVAMTMSDPNLWSSDDLDVILGHYGAFVVERPMQTDIKKALVPLSHYDKIWVVNSSYNDVSSTKIRAQLRNHETVQDLPKRVYEYIKKHGLYQGSPLQSHKKALR